MAIFLVVKGDPLTAVSQAARRGISLLVDEVKIGTVYCYAPNDKLDKVIGWYGEDIDENFPKQGSLLWYNTRATESKPQRLRLIVTTTSKESGTEFDEDRDYGTVSPFEVITQLHEYTQQVLEGHIIAFTSTVGLDEEGAKS